MPQAEAVIGNNNLNRRRKMANKIVQLIPITQENNAWVGDFLALHDDGSLSLIETGEDAGKKMIRRTSLPIEVVG